METQTHIVHDRSEDRQRTIGYRIVEADQQPSIRVVCAETRCHPNDNFRKDTARAHVNARLNSYESGARSPKLRAFEAALARSAPTNAEEYRALENELLMLADHHLPIPAALRR